MNQESNSSLILIDRVVTPEFESLRQVFINQFRPRMRLADGTVHHSHLVLAHFLAGDSAGRENLRTDSVVRLRPNEERV